MILATDEDTKVKDAVALRFKELCEERNISPNALAVRSGVTPSTVYSMLDSSQQSVTVPTVKKLCDGLGITLVDFFNASIFTTIDQEIRYRFMCPIGNVPALYEAAAIYQCLHYSPDVFLLAL